MIGARHKVRRWLPLVLCSLAILAAGCACPLSESVRQRARRELTLDRVKNQANTYRDETVIWGGIVLECRNEKERTDLVILETPLGPACKPGEPRQSRGRFMARTGQFLDPEVYTKGTRVVLGGKLAEEETGKIGDADYTYPVILVEDIYVYEDEEPEYRAPGPWYYHGYPYTSHPMRHPWYP